MVVVPKDKPITTPEAFIVATVVLLLLHEPLGVASANVVVLFSHTLVAPVIGATINAVFTSTSAVTDVTHPLPSVTL